MMKSWITIILLFFFTSCHSASDKPNLIITTDIGGSDPDDYQSMVHFLMYADRFDIKGLISSPPHQGRKEHIEEVLYAYEKDYAKLQTHGEFPAPESIFQVTKQGATEVQEADEPTELSEGAAWIIEKAREEPDEPLWILSWGSITDVAQAVHHDPSIKQNIRVYYIGSWNTKQDPKSRDYLFNHHPDLWWVESNTTFRGMYMGGYQEEDFGNESFVATHVKGHGALGDLFYSKKTKIKMTDTSSLFYLLDGNPDDPTTDSWGGAYVKTGHGENYYTDNPADSLQENERKGAKTINKHRKEFLSDWAERMKWLLP
jgi:hypothetical protein